MLYPCVASGNLVLFTKTSHAIAGFTVTSVVHFSFTKDTF